MFKQREILALEEALSGCGNQEALVVLERLKKFVGLSEDDYDPQTTPFSKPILMQEGYVSLVEAGKGMDVVINSEIELPIVEESLILPIYDVKYDPHGPCSRNKPLYDLYLIPSQSEPRDPEIPMVEYGTYFPIGQLRKQTEDHRFPAYAQKMVSGLHVQIHKMGERIKFIRCSDGKVLFDYTCFISYPEYAVFNAVVNDEKYEYCLTDVLAWGENSAAYGLAAEERVKLLSSVIADNNVKIVPHQLTNSIEEIDALPEGSYIIKWIYERVYPKRPYWFTHKVKKDLPGAKGNSGPICDWEDDDDESVEDEMVGTDTPLVDQFFLIDNEEIWQDDQPCKFIVHDNTMFIAAPPNREEIIVMPLVRECEVKKGSCIFGYQDNNLHEIFFIKDDKIERFDARLKDGKFELCSQMNHNPIPTIMTGDPETHIKDHLAYVNYNPLALEALDNLGYSLPENWQSYMEKYEDEPRWQMED